MMACHGEILIGVIWSLQLDLKAQGSILGRGGGPDTRTKARQVGKDRRSEFIDLAIILVARNDLDGKSGINAEAVCGITVNEWTRKGKRKQDLLLLNLDNLLDQKLGSGGRGASGSQHDDERGPGFLAADGYTEN